ncbi:Membrane spanning protein [Clostridiaceae bacterium JG1575]|nr:Membrane spanning protein [Clostridiaceae bacterium JG1575]
MNELTVKMKEVGASLAPVVLLVLLLHATWVPLPGELLLRFSLGVLLIFGGLTFLLIGIEGSITPLGASLGSWMTRKGKVWLVLTLGLLLGFLITLAEPDLQILAGQLEGITRGELPRGLLIGVVSLGVALVITLGLLRILYAIALQRMLFVAYGLILFLAFWVGPDFLAVAFDASGATTGALTVPFVLALALGVSALKKDSKGSEEDAFGLVGLASAGAILAVLLLRIVRGGSPLSGAIGLNESMAGSGTGAFFAILPTLALDSLVSLLPLLVFFLIFQGKGRHWSKRGARRILLSFFFAFLGLVLFLWGVHAGFMEVGRLLGYRLTRSYGAGPLLLAAFLLGFFTILSEPAVHVLTHQVQEVTSGYVPRPLVLSMLCLGVGAAVALSALRIITPGLLLWHYLLPGYLTAFLLSFFAPKLFVGIAFDSGGVASGPMTATFILAFMQGITKATPGASPVADGFGMIAMVAMTPLIALQVLGVFFRYSGRKKEIHS